MCSYISAKTMPNGEIEYTWESGELARINRSFLDGDYKVGDYLEIGPYLSEIVGYDMVSDNYIVRNVESLRGSLLATWYKARRMLAPLTFRTIMTLAVWGLANKPAPGERVGWHLIKERWF